MSSLLHCYFTVTHYRISIFSSYNLFWVIWPWTRSPCNIVTMFDVTASTGQTEFVRLIPCLWHSWMTSAIGYHRLLGWNQGCRVLFPRALVVFESQARCIQNYFTRAQILTRKVAIMVEENKWGLLSIAMDQKVIIRIRTLRLVIINRGSGFFQGSAFRYRTFTKDFRQKIVKFFVCWRHISIVYIWNFKFC